MTLKETSASIGKGLVAGLAGTAAMTLSSTLEMKLRDREASDAPVSALETLLGLEFEDEETREQVSNLVHWTYGTAWGGARGCLDAVGLRELQADGAHFAAIWGAALIMLPSLNVAPPATEWGAKELAIDAFHHAVYAAATGVVYRLLQNDK